MAERRDVALGEEWNWPCVRELSDKTNNDLKVMQSAEENYLLEEAFDGMEDYIKRNILEDDKEDTDATTEALRLYEITGGFSVPPPQYPPSASSFTSPTFSRSPLGSACRSPAIRREKREDQEITSHTLEEETRSQKLSSISMTLQQGLCVSYQYQAICYVYTY